MNSRNLVRVAVGGLLAMGMAVMACAAGPVDATAIEQRNGIEPPLGIVVPDEADVANLVTTEDAKTPDERSSVASAFKTSFTILTGEATLWSGNLLRIGKGFGEYAAVDEPLSGAGYINIGADAAWIKLASGDMIPLEPGALLFTEQQIDDQIAPIDDVTSGQRKCDTGCGQNSYACCNFGVGGANPTCLCWPNRTTHTCANGGGPGATTCSLVQ